MSSFPDWLATRGYAPRTVQEYDKWARRWSRWCWAHDTTPVEAPVRLIVEWSEALPPGRESRKQAHSALAQLHDYLGRDDEGHGAIRIPPKPHTRTPPLEDDEARMLRDAAVMVGGRGGAVVLIGLYTTARRIEIARMRWSDMDMERSRIRFERAKHGGQADLHMHETVAKALVRLHRPGGSDYLFPGNNGREHVTPTTVWKWVRNVGRTCGVEVRTHQLRATAITALAERHGPLIAASAAGHRDINETMCYVRDQARARDAAIADLSW